MGYIYLINEIDTNKYKIGLTNKKDINERKKQLQTGNSIELELCNFYETDYPHRLEAMLHRYLKQYNIKGEWFELSDDIIKNFNQICDKYNNIIIILKKENPFYD